MAKLMELIIRGRFNGKNCLNRFNYVAEGTPASVSLSFALISAFGLIPDGGVYPGTAPLAFWRTLISDEFTFVEGEAKAVYSLTDFYTRPFLSAITGQDTTTATSPFDAYGLRTNRVRSDIRRATKRFAGATEGAVEEFGMLAAATLTNLDNLADALSAALTYDDEGNTLTFSPAVCKREEYTTPGGKKAYRYLATEAAQLADTATGILWEAYPDVRTQNSRKD